jgi:hypothetical protein
LSFADLDPAELSKADERVADELDERRKAVVNDVIAQGRS